MTEEEKARLRAMSGGSISSLVRSLLARGDAVAKAESKILSAPSLGGVMFGAYLAHVETDAPESWGVVRVSADGTRRKVLGGIGRAEAIDRARVFAETLHDSDGAVTELLITPRPSRDTLTSTKG